MKNVYVHIKNADEHQEFASLVDISELEFMIKRIGHNFHIWFDGDGIIRLKAAHDVTYLPFDEWKLFGL